MFAAALLVPWMLCTAGADDPSWYVRGDTWAETLRQSREALLSHERSSGRGRPLPDLGAGDFTIAAWVRTTASGGVVLAKAPVEGDWRPQGKVLFLRDGRPVFDVGWVGFVAATVAVDDGHWHHVALTCGQQLTFHVDGEPAGRGRLEQGPDPEGFVFRVGFCCPDFPDPPGFEGSLDDVRLYQRRLEPAEIEALASGAGAVAEGLVGRWSFEEGARDDTGGGNHGTLAGNAGITEADDRRGKVLRLDGQGSVELPTSGARAAREEIWRLVERDFPDEGSRRAMRWEREDGIWEADWEPGDLAELASRYAAATRTGVSSSVTDVGGLAALRRAHHEAREVDEVTSDLRRALEPLRRDVEHVAGNYLDDPPAWQSFRAQLERLENRARELELSMTEGSSWSLVRADLVDLVDRTAAVHAAMPRRLPSGPPGPGRFGAYHASLPYALEWDEAWRVGPHSDVVVRFERFPARFVFWRGTSYVPCWVTGNGIWYSNEFVERRGGSSDTEGCCEPMSDKQTRHSHVRVLESHEARVVVHWRYSPVDVQYRQPFVDAVSGWGDWVDELYVIYPDGVGVRRATLHSSAPGEWVEWQEAIVLNQPGTRPEDHLEIGAVTLANLAGESRTFEWTEDGAPAFDGPTGACIEVVNLKSAWRPFAIVPPEGARITPYRGHAPGSRFHSWNHWPVSQDRSWTRVATTAEQPSHTSLSHISGWPDHTRDENSRTKLMLHGMTDGPATDLVPVARSWLSPPVLEVVAGAATSRGFDAAQRAWVLACAEPGRPGPLTLRLSASPQSPLVRPALLLEGWGRGGVTVAVGGQTLSPGEHLRLGHVPSERGLDLVVWLDLESTVPVVLALAPEPG